MAQSPQTLPPHAPELGSGAARSGDLRFVLLRFAISGSLNGLVYAAAFVAATRGFGLPVFAASILGYLAGLTVGFLLHRNFTFLAGGHWRRQAIRYGLAQALVLAIVSAASQFVASVMQWPTYAVIATGIAVAPVLTFTLLNYWVFSPKTPSVC